MLLQSSPLEGCYSLHTSCTEQLRFKLLWQFFAPVEIGRTHHQGLVNWQQTPISPRWYSYSYHWWGYCASVAHTLTYWPGLRWKWLQWPVSQSAGEQRTSWWGRERYALECCGYQTLDSEEKKLSYYYIYSLGIKEWEGRKKGHLGFPPKVLTKLWPPRAS